MARAHATHEADCNSLARRYSGALLLWAITGLLVACGGGGGEPTPAGLTDGGIHAPPTTGTYAYNTFMPGAAAFPAVGGTYTDPVFGTTIKRLSNVIGNANIDDIYSKHQANANGTLSFQRTLEGVNVINVNTGAIVHIDQPKGVAEFEMHWDALDPDKYYYFSGTSLVRRNLAAQTSSVIKDFGPEVTTAVFLSFVGSTGTITRSAGSFVGDGFVAGSTIIVNGTASNNGIYTINTVTELVITVDITVDVLVDEGPVSASITTASFVGSTGTIARSAGSFVADGFVAGSTIIVNGTAANNGTYTINTVTELVITVDITVDELVDEGPVSASITTALQANGGSLNIQSRDGRYFTVRYNGTNKVWDSQTDTIYSGSVQPLKSTGWVSITPDGNYIVNAAGFTPSPQIEHHSYPINHSTQSIGGTPTQFWGICGAHADILTASNGKNYYIGFGCHGTNPGLYRVDITLDQAGESEAQQQATNQLLIPLDWNDNDGHLSAVSKGAFRDWVFLSTENAESDPYNGGTLGWTAYKQEIIAVNVLTLEVRRLAHHRSRGLADNNFWSQPRVSSSWDGSVVMWASNYNISSPTGYADLYAIQSPLGLPAP
jgi:hypothetical protein